MSERAPDEQGERESSISDGFYICYGPGYPQSGKPPKRFVALRTRTDEDIVTGATALAAVGIGSPWATKSWVGSMADPAMSEAELRDRLEAWRPVVEGGTRTETEVKLLLGAEAVEAIFGYRLTVDAPLPSG